MSEQMQSTYRWWGRWFMALALLLVPMTTARAAGTPAYTEILARATGTFTDAEGRVMPVVFSNRVVAIVQQIAAVDVSPAFEAHTAEVGGMTVFAVQVTNIGNGLDTLSIGQTDLPPEWSSVIYQDLNRNGILDPDEMVPANEVAVAVLEADSTAYVLIKVTVPGTAADGQSETVTLTAVSQFDTNVNDSGDYQTDAVAPVLSLLKDVNIINPNPGDVVTYAITYENTGTNAAFNAILTDPMPSELTYEPGSIRVAAGAGITYENAQPQTDAADADSVEFGITIPGALRVFLGDVTVGQTGMVFFRARVNEGVPAGSEIDNVATVTFESPQGTPEQSQDSPPVTITVQFKANVALDIPSAYGMGEPGDSVFYYIAATNLGNDEDVLNLTSESSEGFAHTIWVDANEDSVAGNDGDFILSDSNQDGTPDLNRVASGDSVRLIVIVTIPSATPDSTIDVVTLTLSSSAEPAVMDEGTVTTLVKAPVVQVDKTVNPRGSQPAGQELTYTITVNNTGGGIARDMVLRDGLPEHTTYIANSPTVDGNARTDAEDADDTAVTNDSLVVDLGTIESGASRIVTFRVTINEVSTGTTVINRAQADYTDKSGAAFDTESDEVRTPVNPSIIKEIETVADTLSPGDSLVYRLIIDNRGGDAINIALRDTIDTILALVGVQGNASVRINGQVVEGDWTPYEADRIDTIRVVTFVLAGDPTPVAVRNQAWLDVNGVLIASDIVEIPLQSGEPGADGEIIQPEYVAPGEDLVVIVRDTDLNSDPNAIEEITVTVTSDRTGEVESVVLRETDVNSGEFVGTVPTLLHDETGQNDDGVMHVQPADPLDGLYHDESTEAGPPQDRTARTIVLPTVITLEPDPGTIVGNGVDQSILTARVTDSANRPLPDGTPVLFTADKGLFPNGLQEITVLVSGGNGEAQVIFTAPILAQSDVANVFASFGGFDSDVVMLEVLPGAVAIRVWDQVRNMEVTAGDPDLLVEVTLFGTSVTGQPVLITVTVDESGVFVIPEIPPGTYQLKVKITEIITGRIIFDGILQQIVVNFDGSTTPPKNGISGRIQGRGEQSSARFAGLPVELLDEQGNVIATAVVDENGLYEFQNLDPGMYTLRLRLPDGEVIDTPISQRSRLPGSLIVNVNILIDPFGQTFDAATNTVVSGITVAIETLDGQVLPIPLLDGTGATPNVDNINPYVNVFKGQYAFLFGGDQVGTFGNPVTYLMTATPPDGSPYLPRKFFIDVEPVAPGPITSQSTIKLRARSADGLELALPNTFTLTTDAINVPDIAVIAINIPLFTIAPSLELTKSTVEDTLETGAPFEYVVTVTNTGNDVAENVTISDTLNSDNWRLLDAPGASIPSPNVAVWTIGDLQPDESDTVRLQVEIVPPKANGVTLINTVTARMNRGLPIQAESGVVIRSPIKTSNITLIPNPRTIVGNGSDFSILTARVVDNQGNPLPDGTPVLFTADKGTFPNGLQQITIPISGGNGEAVVIFISPVLTSNDVANVFASFDNVDSDIIDLEVLPGAVAIRVWDQVRNIQVTGGDPEYLVELNLVGLTVNGEPIAYTVTFDQNGIFAVPEIPPGTYQIKANVIEIATGRVVSNGLLQQIVVNFDGSTSQPKNAVSGMVRGRGEKSGARYAGLPVDLLDEFGVVVQSALLDAEGRYDFQGLDPGRYSVRFRLPDGEILTAPVNSISQLSGSVVINVEVLIDPFGQTFDAVTRALVPGVTVTMETLDGQPLPIPALAGTGAVPNVDNINPFVTTSTARFAFLFSGDQVGTFGNPVTYVLTAAPPTGSPYLPRRMLMVVEPIDPGPITSESPIKMQVRSADGLEIARGNSFTLTRNPITVPDIAVIAINIPLFTVAPVLEMTKTAVPDTLRPGEGAEFVITVANIGNADALDVTVSDTLTQDWRLLSTTPSALIVGPNAVQWSVGDMAPGQVDTLRIQVELLPPQLDGTVLRNVAHAETPLGLTVDAIEDVTVQALPTWEITVRAEVDTVGPGQDVPYVVTIRNISAQIARGFSLVDSLASEITTVSVDNGETPVPTKPTAPGDYLAGGQITGPHSIIWPLPDMVAGQLDSARFISRTIDTLKPGTVIVDRAFIFGPKNRIWGTSAAAIASRPPRLSLIKEASRDTVFSGDTVEFTLIMKNNDVFTVAGPIALVDSLAPSMKLVSARGKPVVSGNVLNWTLTGLAPGQADTMSLVVQIETDEPIVTNTAWLEFFGQKVVANADVAVQAAVALAVTKEASAVSVEPGQQIDYTITVTAMADTVPSAAVRDTLPFELAYVPDSSQPAAAYDSLAHVLTWALSDLIPNGTQTLQFAVTPVAGLAPGEYQTSNVAVGIADSTAFGSNPADVLISVPFFLVQKQSDQSVAETGDFVIYRVTVENLSTNDPLTDVVVRDRLPHGFDYISGTARLDGQPLEPERLNARDMVWRFPRLDAGQSRLLTYRLVLGTDAISGDGTNIVTAEATTPHGLPASAGPARARVRVRPDLFSQGQLVIGRAWIDENENGIHDRGEPPVPGASFIMEDGTRIIADKNGRFSIPEIRFGSHVLRLMNHNIPPDLEPVVLGTRSARDPWIRFMDVSQSGLTKANFPFRRIPEPLGSTLQKTARVMQPPVMFWIERLMRLEKKGTGATEEASLNLDAFTSPSNTREETMGATPKINGTSTIASTFSSTSKTRQDAAGATPKALDSRFRIVFRTHALGVPVDHLLTIFQDTPPGYLVSPFTRGQNTGTVMPGDSLVFFLATDLIDLPNLFDPQIVLEHAGYRGEDSTAPSYRLMLRSLGRTISDTLARDVWVAELSLPVFAADDSAAGMAVTPVDTVYAGGQIEYSLSVFTPDGGQLVDVAPQGAVPLAADSLATIDGDTIRWTLPDSATYDLWARMQIDTTASGHLLNKAVFRTSTRSPEALVSVLRDSAAVAVLPRPPWKTTSITKPETLLVEVKSTTLENLGADSFISGSAELTDVVKRPLLALRDRLSRSLTQNVLITGHTDSDPINTRRFPNNEVLSIARANAVRDWLVEAGVDSSRIITEGYGPQRPVATNATSEGKRQNRRVELELVETVVDHVPYIGQFVRTTVVTYEGTMPIEQLDVVDSLSASFSYIEGSASVTPFLQDGVLRWILHDVQPGETFSVTYEFEAEGEASGDVELVIPTVVSYSLPDGQWITNSPVIGQKAIVKPLLHEAVRGEGAGSE